MTKIMAAVAVVVGWWC